jgi:hypothetical protein
MHNHYRGSRSWQLSFFLHRPTARLVAGSAGAIALSACLQLRSSCLATRLSLP